MCFHSLKRTDGPPDRRWRSGDAWAGARSGWDCAKARHRGGGGGVREYTMGDDNSVSPLVYVPLETKFLLMALEKERTDAVEST